MKTNIIIATLLFCIFGCTSKQNEPLTQQQNEQIKKEVKLVIDSAFARFEKLDVNGVLKYYSPEFVYVGDTSLIPYQSISKAWIEFINSVALLKFTKVHWECIVLNKDLAISTWFGKTELMMKSGEKTTFNPQKYTDILKKVGGKWKIICEHGSGVSVTDKAEK